MSKCCWCKKEIDEDDNELYDELCVQADFWGMQSLTENGQLFVEGSMCEDCYLEL